jgi:predicted dehydrogenase
MLRLGLIGMSDGNGHPYSWAAIVNGYNKEVMETCPFSAIPAYLDRQSFPRDQIRGAEVTHIWTQDNVLSDHIARASKIPNVVSHVTDMLGKVDGILLARDDAENHYEIAKPFLEAGLPIYIDKPVSLTTETMRKIFGSAVSYSQVFSCSALRYAKEIMPTESELKDIGRLVEVSGVTPNHWDKYAVHVIDPIISFLDSPALVASEKLLNSGATKLNIIWDSGIRSTVEATGKDNGEIAFIFVGEKGIINKTFSNSFLAFKASLEDFISNFVVRSDRNDYDYLKNVVRIIELGR